MDSRLLYDVELPADCQGLRVDEVLMRVLLRATRSDGTILEANSATRSLNVSNKEISCC